MKTSTLLLRNLVHYRRTHLAVLAGCIVGTAVLGGALLVGDSVRGSLRDLTLRRLGKVEFAVSAPRFVRADLADAVPAAGGGAGIIQAQGSVIREADGARMGRVNVLGVDNGFWNLLRGSDELKGYAGADDVFINDALALDLGVATNDSLLVRIDSHKDIPSEALFGQRKFEETVLEMRVRVFRILKTDGNSGPGSESAAFSLAGGQQTPRNLYMARDNLQRRLKRRDQVNTLIFGALDDTSRHGRQAPSADEARARLQQLLNAAVTPADLGLSVRIDKARNYVAVESPQMLIDPVAEEAIGKSAGRLGLTAVPMLTHLANRIAAGSKSVRYSTVTAVDPAAVGLKLADGSPAPALGDGEILISEWSAAATDLDLAAAKPGTEIRLTYFVEGERAKLREESHTFKLRGLVKLDDTAGDRGFAPAFPGITDKSDMGSWDAPFPIDKDYIRNVPLRDDRWWRKYKTAPKAFVSLAAGRKLWAGRFGNSTAVRLLPRSDNAEAAATAFSAELPKQLPAEKTGLVVRAVKAEGLAASEGATDFGQLFVGFSFFLIISAALLVGLLFRLGVDQRLRELGVLTALGFTAARLRRLLLAEGAVVSVIGGLLGAAAAAGYAWLMLAGLRTLWVDAVGTNQLSLHIEPTSLIIAAVAGPAVAMVAVLFSLRGLRHVGPRALLGGPEGVYPAAAGDRRGAGKWAWVTLWVAGVGALGAMAAAFALKGPAQAGAFFGAGTLVLTAALAGLNIRLKSAGGGSAAKSLGRLAIRNAARRPARSALTVGLTASAAFVIIAVAAQRHDVGKDVRNRDSGAGGFVLTAETDLPILHDLNSPAGRAELGFTKADEVVLAGTTIVPFRLRPGDDASCKNLYRPEEPRILGVPKEMVERRGFAFADHWGKWSIISDPWELMGDRRLRDDEVGAFGDANTLQWIMHKSLDDAVPVRADDGREVPLRLRGALSGSIFQSELLIPEAAFIKLFPGRAGHRFFLIDAPPDKADAVAKVLNARLAEFGVYTEGTAEKLEAFAAIERTYISTFQQLGGLGLLLGTLGLGAVMLRSVLERRGELALLRAIGFRRTALAGLVMLENGALLFAGLAIGAFAALPAAAPPLMQGGGLVPWGQLAVTLGAVAAVGLLAGTVAAYSVLKTPLLPALRSE